MTFDFETAIEVWKLMAFTLVTGGVTVLVVIGYLIFLQWLLKFYSGKK